MKSLVALFALAGTAMADTAQFVNTTFTGPFSVGQVVPLMWTAGNSLPVSLSIFNATWNSTVFAGRSIATPSYNWTVAAPAGFIAGNYQLVLTQTNGGANVSPAFKIFVLDGITTSTPVSSSTSTTTTTTSATSTTTVTLIYWDQQCGCRKTTTATTRLNTGLPGTTTVWWDDHCSCHKTAMVPMPTMAPSNNYTAPAAPPANTVAATSARPVQPTSTGSAAPTSYTGGASRFGSSMLGVMALVGIAGLA